MLPKKRSRECFSIRWRARARVVFLPDRPNCVPSYPAPRCPVAPPCALPTRPARGVSGFWIRQVRWTFVSRANSFVGTQSCATPPGRSAGLPDPTRPWYVRVLDSTVMIYHIICPYVFDNHNTNGHIIPYAHLCSTGCCLISALVPGPALLPSTFQCITYFCIILFFPR